MTVEVKHWSLPLALWLLIGLETQILQLTRFPKWMSLFMLSNKLETTKIRDAEGRWQSFKLSSGGSWFIESGFPQTLSDKIADFSQTTLKNTMPKWHFPLKSQHNLKTLSDQYMVGFQPICFWHQYFVLFLFWFFVWFFSLIRKNSTAFKTQACLAHHFSILFPDPEKTLQTSKNFSTLSKLCGNPGLAKATAKHAL